MSKLHPGKIAYQCDCCGVTFWASVVTLPAKITFGGDDCNPDSYTEIDLCDVCAHSLVNVVRNKKTPLSFPDNNLLKNQIRLVSDAIEEYAKNEIGELELPGAFAARIIKEHFQILNMK
jgi:hypothetical protein